MANEEKIHYLLAIKAGNLVKTLDFPTAKDRALYVDAIDKEMKKNTKIGQALKSQRVTWAVATTRFPAKIMPLKRKRKLKGAGKQASWG